MYVEAGSNPADFCGSSAFLHLAPVFVPIVLIMLKSRIVSHSLTEKQYALFRF